MKDCRGYFECIAVCVDNLLIAYKDPRSIVKCLLEYYEFKLKGTSPIKCYLGCNFFRDSENVLYFTPRKYVSKMTSIFKTTFGDNPSTKVHSPPEKGDYPELDTSEFLDTEGIQKYQSLVSAMQ